MAKSKISAKDLKLAQQLSPNRKTSTAKSIEELVSEQIDHFSIDPDSDLGQKLAKLIHPLYLANVQLHHIWQESVQILSNLACKDKAAFFNAKRFICFQMAKLLDNLQNPLRKSYQSLVTRQSTITLKGPYPIFDNVTAIFSSTPVITRTATYLYACTEWIDEAFQGREPLHEIYSRLMNPTSICLANYIVDVEAGSMADEYFAWNFNSGMAAIDSILSHLLGYRDIIITSRNIYGGSYQLINNWFGKNSNLDIEVVWFDGYTGKEFSKAYASVLQKHQDRVEHGSHIYVFLESPCNPHGYVLDVPEICKMAHKEDLTVLCDSTVGTPFLHRVLKHDDPALRPDYVIHSYTKDLTGNGSTTAGVVIGRNETMFLPKGETCTYKSHNGDDKTISWDNTLFWNVYFIKGAFLDSEKAFDVIEGMRTLELRMIRKCINTIVLSRILSAHPEVHVHCSAVKGNENYSLTKKLMHLELPAPLFTIDFEKNSNGKIQIDRKTFKKFFDCLEPAFGFQVSLGQVNTVILCPAMTSHSELSEDALKDAGIHLTTVRISVGDEDPRSLLAHFINISKLILDPIRPGFSKKFMKAADIDTLYKKTYLDVHKRYIESKPSMDGMLCN